MLDNLVESKNNSENTARRGGYLLTTSVLVFSLFASGILWSLFAKDLNMGGDNLELSSMVAPVPMPESEPPPPEIVREVKQNTTTKTESAVVVRNDNIARIDETQPIPNKISNIPSQTKVRPNGNFVVNPDVPETNGGTVNRGDGQESTNNATSKIVVKPREVEKTDVDLPPTIKKVEPKPEPKVEKPRPPVSGGVLNGKALSLPKPPYPAAAKAIRVSGDVNVQVTIDEKGNVISANAVSGHALLKQVSEQAARSAKFSPTMIGTQPVKVTGLIVYKFAVQ